MRFVFYNCCFTDQSLPDEAFVNSLLSVIIRPFCTLRFCLTTKSKINQHQVNAYLSPLSRHPSLIRINFNTRHNFFPFSLHSVLSIRLFLSIHFWFNSPCPAFIALVISLIPLSLCPNYFCFSVLPNDHSTRIPRYFSTPFNRSRAFAFLMRSF